MSTNESKIKLASKLYRCRDAVKSMFPDRYQEKIEPYKLCIINHMERTGKDELGSVLEITSDEKISSHGVTVLLLMAAAVELIEP